jgi:hypothetical protein
MQMPQMPSARVQQQQQRDHRRHHRRVDLQHRHQGARIRRPSRQRRWSPQHLTHMRQSSRTCMSALQCAEQSACKCITAGEHSACASKLFCFWFVVHFTISPFPYSSVRSLHFAFTSYSLRFIRSTRSHIPTTLPSHVPRAPSRARDRLIVRATHHHCRHRHPLPLRRHHRL